MKSRGLLVVDPDRTHRDALLAHLEQLPRTVAVEQFACWEDARLRAARDGDDVILVDWAALDESARRDVVRWAETSEGRLRALVLMAPMRTREQCASLLAPALFRNIVPTVESANADELLATVEKLLGDDIFGIEKYFSNAKRERFVMSRASERRALMDHAETHLQALNASARVTGDFCTVIDEFVTNAFYNAPVDDAGAHRFAHRARSEDAELEHGEEVIVEICSDGRRIGLATIDPFGSISASLILEHLARCFRREDPSFDRARGGAGLGLYYAFDLLSHFVVDLAPGKKTEMIGIIDTDARPNPRRGKSLNIFVGSS